MTSLLYQIISLINIFGCIAALVIMTRFLIKYEVAELFANYFFGKFVMIFLVSFNNVATFWKKELIVTSGWTLKIAGVFAWVLAIVLCLCVKKISREYQPKTKKHEKAIGRVSTPSGDA